VKANLILQDAVVKNSETYEEPEITMKANGDSAALMVENNQVCCKLHEEAFNSMIK
jgi:translation elongation factor P/translation initiation factor 5A